jgi:hypothetical protein
MEAMTARKRRVSRLLRERIAQAAGYCCGYCRTPERIAGFRLTIEHIIPEARRGKTIEENLWLACHACNECKGVRVQARDPETGKRVRLWNPRRQQWRDHFRWSEDGTEIVGLTPAGRATVAALELNRREVVAARWLWVQVGWWPPREEGGADSIE